MRNWKVDSKLLCTCRFLGSWREIWGLIGELHNNMYPSIFGHIRLGQVEIHDIERQYTEHLEEAERRGYNFKRRMTQVDLDDIQRFLDSHPKELWGKIDIDESMKLLQKRSYVDKCKYNPLRILNRRY
jgi:hypothetical protein